MAETLAAPVVLTRGDLWLTFRCTCGLRGMIGLVDGVQVCRRCGQSWRYVPSRVEAG